MVCASRCFFGLGWDPRKMQWVQSMYGRSSGCNITAACICLVLLFPKIRSFLFLPTRDAIVVIRVFVARQRNHAFAAVPSKGTGFETSKEVVALDFLPPSHNAIRMRARGATYQKVGCVVWSGPCPHLLYLSSPPALIRCFPRGYYQGSLFLLGSRKAGPTCRDFFLFPFPPDQIRSDHIEKVMSCLLFISHIRLRSGLYLAYYLACHGDPFRLVHAVVVHHDQSSPRKTTALIILPKAQNSGQN